MAITALARITALAHIGAIAYIAALAHIRGISAIHACAAALGPQHPANPRGAQSHEDLPRRSGS